MNERKAYTDGCIGRRESACGGKGVAWGGSIGVHGDESFSLLRESGTLDATVDVLINFGCVTCELL